jgi:hypothetical protein
MRFIVVAIASVVLFFPAFWLFNAVVGPNWGAGIAAFGMYIAFPILALKVWPDRKVVERPSMETALANGDLMSSEYTVSEAAEVDEFEDEGKHFYLAVGPKDTLFLTGQYLYSPADNGVFHSTKIRVFWHKSLGLTYGVECLGQPMISLKCPEFSENHFENDVIRGDRQIINQDLRTVLQKIWPDLVLA